MTKLQFISLLTPACGSVLLVILAWLHQNQRLSDLRDDMHRKFADNDRQFAEVRGGIGKLSTDYQTFYGMEQKLEGRVDELSKRVA